MTAHPFRFTLQGSRCRTVAEFTELARKAEDLGYQAVTIADHFDGQVGPLVALAAAAQVTTTLELGTLVLANDYRHPVVAAKEIASLDELSGGRVIFGLGAGWALDDYEHAGLTLDRPGVRIDRLTEALDVYDALFSGEPVSFHGTHYRVDGIVGAPRPVRQPRPTLLIGGGGKRMLQLAASRADIVAVNVNLAGGRIDASVGPDATAERTDQKVAWIREAAAGPGDGAAAPGPHPRGGRQRRPPGHGRAPRRGPGPHARRGAAVTVPDRGLGRRRSSTCIVARRERWGFTDIGLSSGALEEFAPVVARLAGTS